MTVSAPNSGTPAPPNPGRSFYTAWLRVWPYVHSAVMLLVFGIALWFLRREFQSLHAQDVAESFRRLPLAAVVAAVVLTILNYIVMIGYDWLGVHILGRNIDWRKVATASLLSYALSNSLGTLLGGTPTRARLYSAWGLTSPEVVRLIFLIGLAFWIGLCTLGGVLFLAFPLEIPGQLHLPLSQGRWLGLVLLMIAATFFLSCALRRRPIHILGINFQPPSLRYGLAQAGIAAMDFLLASATLYVLLPPDLPIGFFPFASIYVLAILLVLISNVPGGLGVLELVMVAMLPESSQSLVASLVMFRVVYYLMPLILAVAAIAIQTLRHHRQRVTGAVSLGREWAAIMAPRVLTVGVFVAGLILLVSGALPPVEGRMALVRRALPLPLIELSHFAGSVVGAMLLVLARGLARRIDAAWFLSILLLTVGAVASLAKGLDYEEAILLTLLNLALLPCHPYFHRRGRLFAPTWDVTWISAALLALGLTAWLTWFAYRHVEYSQDLWWRFAMHGDAPRSLRALVGAAVVLCLAAVGYLLKPRRLLPAPPSATDWEEVLQIVRSDESTSANLALLGDKRFIFSDDRQAFVMFGCEGYSWITMGDPLGPKESADEAAWRFRECCDAQGVWPVFYQVDESALARYVEMGLSLIKLGEEARVPLHDFSLEGGSRKDLRRTNKKAADSGLRFEILDQGQVAMKLPLLKSISDAWLATKHAAEKGFSLGFFSEEYLRRYDVAMVIHDESPVAFANLWQSAGKKELSVDLMRFVPNAPHGTMEYLFLQLMLWGHAQGFEYFNLGMAPLSGVEAHRLGPLWNHVSNLLFQHGEHFYNFQGLRHYKEKFEPEWSPKYLASPGGLILPQILANVATLIAGGKARLLRR